MSEERDDIDLAIDLAKDNLRYAKKHLVAAANHFQSVDGNGFDKTIAEIKQVIGDLECALALPIGREI